METIPKTATWICSIYKTCNYTDLLNKSRFYEYGLNQTIYVTIDAKHYSNKTMTKVKFYSMKNNCYKEFRNILWEIPMADTPATLLKTSPMYFTYRF